MTPAPSSATPATPSSPSGTTDEQPEAQRDGNAPAVTVSATKPSLRVTLLRQAAQYSVGTGLSMLAGIARAGVGAKFLSAEEIGAWLGLQVLLGYASNLHFGSLFGMFRSVPIKIAQGDPSGADSEERTSLTFVAIIASLGFAVGLGVVPTFLPEVQLRHIVFGLSLAAITLLKAWSVTTFKAERRFGELSVSSTIGAVFAFGSVAAIPSLGLDALLAGMIVQGAVEILALAFYKGAPRFGLSRSILAAQLKVGFVTLLTNIGITALTTIERTVMLRMLGVAATGTFVIGAQIVFLVPVLAAIPAAVLTPILFERVGRGQDLMPAIHKPVMLLSYAFSWIIGAGLVGVAPVVEIVWPHLVEGNSAAKLALIGTLPMILAGPISNVFYAINRQWPLVALLSFATAVTAVTTWFGVRLSGTIAGAAGGATAGLYVYYVAAVLVAFRVVGISWKESLRFLARSLLPIIYVLAAVVVFELVIARFYPAHSVVRALIAQVVILAAMSPWLRRALGLLRGRS